ARPRPDEWTRLYPRYEALATKLMDGVGAEPGALLGLSRHAQKREAYDASLRLARLGIESSTRLHVAADHTTLLELHATAAWLCLLCDRPGDADENLAALHKSARQFWGVACLVEGFAAIDTGDPDRAVTQFQLALQHPEFGRSLYPMLGLTHALLAGGRF